MWCIVMTRTLSLMVSGLIPCFFCAATFASDKMPLSRRLSVNKHGVNSIEFSADGSRIVVGYDDSLSIWRVADARLVEQRALLGVGDGPVNNAHFSMDGKQVVHVSDRQVKAYEINSKSACQVLLETGTGKVGPHQMDLSPDGTLLAVTGVDSDPAAKRKVDVGKLIVYDLKARRTRMSVLLLDQTPDSLRFAPDGMSLVVAGSGMLRFYSMKEFKETKRIKTRANQNHGYDAIEFSPDGTKVVVRIQFSGFELWDVVCAKKVRELAVAGDIVCESRIVSREFTFSPDGKTIAMSPCAGRIELRDVSTGKLLSVVFTNELITALAFSPKGNVLASGSIGSRGELILWNVKQMLSRGVKAK